MTDVRTHYPHAFDDKPPRALVVRAVRAVARHVPYARRHTVDRWIGRAERVLEEVRRTLERGRK